MIASQAGHLQAVKFLVAEGGATRLSVPGSTLLEVAVVTAVRKASTGQAMERYIKTLQWVVANQPRSHVNAPMQATEPYVTLIRYACMHGGRDAVK